MQIFYFGVGSLNNADSSVDGGKYIRLPLMQEMLLAGHTVKWIGFHRQNYAFNPWLKLVGLYPNNWLIDVKTPNGVLDNSADIIDDNVVITSDKSKLDAFEASLTKDSILFVELRPNEDKPGYNFKNEWDVQTYLIELFHSRGLPVFVWDQDVWAENIPAELRNKMTLLTSYYKPVEGFNDQQVFLYGWSRFPFDKALRHMARSFPKKFDVTYCGNVYGRKEEFLEFFAPFNHRFYDVCIQGNWLRKKYDDRDFSLDNFPNFMFMGSTPHWTTLPSIAMSKSVLQFSNPAQQRVGLPTARIFETLMGYGTVFCSDKIQHVDRVVPEEMIYTNAQDLIDKWDKIDIADEWPKMAALLQDKLRTQEFSYATRVKQLEQFTQERIKA